MSKPQSLLLVNYPQTPKGCMLLARPKLLNFEPQSHPCRNPRLRLTTGPIPEFARLIPDLAALFPEPPCPDFVLLAL